MTHLKNRNKTVHRYLEDTYTSEELDQFIDLVQTEEGLSVIEDALEDVWDTYSDVPYSVKQEKYKKEAFHLLKQIRQPKKRHLIPYVVKYIAAAVIIVAIALGGYFTDLFNPETELQYEELRVAKGVSKHLTLEDGTQIVLNAGSYIKYPVRFSAAERSVEIDGEAFFEVNPDEKRPFRVTARNIEVKVLGTSFNVKAYDVDEQFIVSVKTGKVQVDLPEAMVRLYANEQMVLDRKQGEITKRLEDSGRSMNWIKGGLYFNRTPIRSVARDLERRYNCIITFEPGFDYNENIYGEHDNKSLESVLNSIRYTTGIKYRQEDGKYILYK